MHKTTTTLLALALALTLTAGVAQAQGPNEYGWTVSNSNTDPFANTAAPAGGLGTYYLWFQCSTTEGMSAAEMDLLGTGINVLATTPQNGYLNAGGSTDLLLAVGGCPTGPMIALDILVLDAAGGTICIVASALGNNGTVDCQGVPTLWDNHTIGFSSNGSPPPCTFDGFCPSVAIEEVTWGGIKGMYR